MRTGFAALLWCALATGCAESDGTTSEQAAAPPLVLGTAEVARASVVEPIYGTGTITADKTTELGPRVDGIIEEIHVAVGDRVQQGAPLFRNRQVDYRIRLDRAGHAYRLARAEARRVRRDRERIESLHERGVASDQRLDAARTADEMATARLGQARAALARARQDLEDTVVGAPYAGVITRRYVDEGVMLRTMMSANSKVVQIMKTDVVVAIVQIPELHLPRVRLGTPARVHVDGMERAYECAVSVVNDRVDPTSRTIEVRLSIANPALAIKPGLFARAELLPEPRQALVVDRRAVLGAGESRHAYVGVDGRAVRRPITIRELDAQRVEVLEGLTEGERVLVGPNLTLVSEGVPVVTEVARATR